MTAQPERTRTGTRTRVPRNTLCADLIVDAALRLLDEKGMDAFSMRALAEELGVGTMALYTYFRGKEELFHAARDRVMDDFHAPPPEGCWDVQIRTLCTEFYRLLTERPAVLQLLASRVPDQNDISDTATTALERILALLREAGLDRLEASRGYVALLQYTIGTALRHVHTCANGPEAREEQLKRLRGLWAALSADAHPTLLDLTPELISIRQDSTTQYGYGLDLLLAGLRQRVAEARGSARK